MTKAFSFVSFVVVKNTIFNLKDTKTAKSTHFQLRNKSSIDPDGLVICLWRYSLNGKAKNQI